MRIDRLHIERTFNTGNYTSLRVGAEATLAEGDDPAAELYDLKLWLDAEGGRLVAEQLRPSRSPSPDEDEAPIPF